MKIHLNLDGRSYAGSPSEIVRKLRAGAHAKARDLDGYLRATVDRLREQYDVEVPLDGDTVDERCESFLIGLLRQGLATPVFHVDHLDAHAIRVLRRSRGLTQEKLAQLVGTSHVTVNRWEAGASRPGEPSQEALERALFAPYLGKTSSDPVTTPPQAVPARSQRHSLLGIRDAVRRQAREATWR